MLFEAPLLLLSVVPTLNHLMCVSDSKVTVTSGSSSREQFAVRLLLFLEWLTDHFYFFGSFYDSNLVDPASSHMLVLKIKPCMSKYKLLYSETANGSLNQL